MDVFRLKRIINDYCPHALISSFPIAVRGGKGDLRIIWFTFDIPGEEDDEDVRVVTDTAYCMDEDYNVRSVEFREEKTIEYDVTEEPELDYNKHMIRLGEIIEDGSFDEETVRDLLAAGEQFYVADLAFMAAERFAE